MSELHKKKTQTIEIRKLPMALRKSQPFSRTGSIAWSIQSKSIVGSCSPKQLCVLEEKDD
jgi:hypothetical protein